ncbi:unnamed protein product [Symbiodinium sp. KB8]|nr:unnamed protein product [Symbiodinium sp. KB8]
MASPSLDQELKEVFGDLAQNSMTQFGEAPFGSSLSTTPGSEPPSKAPKLEAQPGKRGRGYDNPNSRGQKDQDWYMQWIIRQETQLQILKQNSAWTLYLQPGQAGPVALLHQAAEKYREESKTRFMEVPALLKALHGISSDNNKQQILKDKGWLNAEGNWNYQQWDSEQQALKVSETRQPVNHQDLIGRIGQLTELVLGKDIIHQFNATHTLTPNKTGVTTFLLEVGLRAQGVETTWNTLEMIAGLSALQVIGLQIRREALVAWPTTFRSCFMHRQAGVAQSFQSMLH